MNYKGKKLLILAGVNIHNKVVEAAKKMEIYTIVIDYLPNSPAKQIADEKLMYDIFDVDGLVKWGKEYAIDGVIGLCCDPTSKSAQEIAERLGLPAFGTEEQVLTLIQKPYFKKLCVDNRVDIIPSYTDILSDITSNTATAAVTMPIVISIIQGVGLNPIPYIYVATIGTNLSYMFPTSIRAIPIGYGLEPRYMLKEGWKLTLIVWGLMTLLSNLFLKYWPAFSLA